MDGLTALSIACNVLQTISFAKDTTLLIHQIYQRGSSIDNAELEGSSTRLAELTKLVDGSLNVSQGSQVITPAEKEVRQIASKCRDAAKDLQYELGKLRAQGGKVESLRKGLRTVWKRSEMEKLDKKLSKYQGLLDSGLLLRLREQNDVLAISQVQGFDRLDDTLKKFILDQASTQSTIVSHVKTEGENIRQVNVSEHANTRAQIERQITDLRVESSATAQRAALLKSLRSDDAFTRYNLVSETDFNTFEWIFDDSKPRSWPSFTKWLREGEDIYWIQGKAGSGKSTLMKFIVKHDKLNDLLNIWKPQSKPKLITHFFWLNGSVSQRNLHGLLCSFLYQVLENEADLMDWLIRAESDLRRKQSPGDWSVSQLSVILSKIWQKEQMHMPFCVFLDGLDEFGDEANFQKFIDMLLEWRSFRNIKLCVSCRPDLKIDQQFQGVPLMRLQDLTYTDIEDYANGVLYDLQARLNWVIDKQIVAKITEQIVVAASGVFLWVRLALNDVVRGLTNQDSWEELQRRILRLPKDVYNLYEDMLTRTGEDWEIYRQEAISYIKACLMLRGYNYSSGVWLSPLIMAFAQTGFGIASSFESLLHRCQHIEQRVALCCGGMIEIRKGYSPHFVGFNEAIQYDIALSQLLEHQRLSLVVAHRTVYNYFETPNGLKLLKHCDMKPSTLFLAAVQAALCCAIAEFMRGARVLTDSWIPDMLDHISKLSAGLDIERSTRETAMSLLDKAFISIYGLSFGWNSSTEQCWLEFQIFKSLTRFDLLGAIFEYNLPCSPIFDLSLESENSGRDLKCLTPEYLGYLLQCTTKAQHAHDRFSMSGYHQQLQRMRQLIDAGADVNARAPISMTDLMPASPLVRYIDSLTKLARRNLDVCDRESANLLNVYRSRGACFDQQYLLWHEFGECVHFGWFHAVWNACDSQRWDDYLIDPPGGLFHCLCVGTVDVLLEQILRNCNSTSPWRSTQSWIKSAVNPLPYLLYRVDQENHISVGDWRIIDPVHVPTMQAILAIAHQKLSPDHLATVELIHAQGKKVEWRDWLVHEGWLLTPDHPLYPKGPFKRFRDKDKT